MAKPKSAPASRPTIPTALPAELLLAAIIDSSDDAIVSKDMDGVITSWNTGAERIFGYTNQEVIGKPITLLIPEERGDEEKQILAKIRAGEKIDHFETIRKRKDGTLIEVSVTISPIRSVDGVVIGASKVARDVTERKRTGRAALLLAAIVNSSEDAIVSKNLDGIITSWNAGAERIFGYTAAEAVGRPVLMLVPPDRKDEEPKILQRLKQGQRVDHFETIRMRKNGELFPVSLTISPVKDAQGTVIGASKIARDVSILNQISAEKEQLLASERAARAQAESANRMKDEFLAVVSHELRTPLNAIMGWAEILKHSPNNPAEVTEGAEVIQKNATMQARLIDDMLDLGRISSGKLALTVEWVDIGSIVKDAIESVRHAAEVKSIVIRTILDDVKGGIMGDKRRLQQVI